MKLTIDDITSVSSQTVNVSPTQTKDVAKSLHSWNLDMQRTHSGSGEGLSTLDTPPLVGKPIQLSNLEVDRVGYSSTFSKCRPALLWGRKRKVTPNLAKWYHSKGVATKPLTPVETTKKRSRKFIDKYECTEEADCIDLPTLQFKRVNTEDNINLQREIDEELNEDFKIPNILRRAKSLVKPIFWWCPPPPLNTTQYISRLYSCNIQLPRFDWESREEENWGDADYDENSPETCASMTGKHLQHLYWPILIL